MGEGDIVYRIYIMGGFCPGGFCPGDFVRGDFVLEPRNLSLSFTQLVLDIQALFVVLKNI